MAGVAADGVISSGRPRFLHREAAMRWVHLIVIALFAAAIIVFVVQNLAPVTMSFLGFGLHAPLAVLAAIAYLLGAATGGSLFALLRKSVRASRVGAPRA
jgi:uncharacterized integral membrane protein